MKDRKPHYLKKKKIKKIKSKINLYIDVESNIEYIEGGQVQTFKIAYVIDDVGGERFTDSLKGFYEVLKDYCNDYDNVFVYAHNMRGYDSLVLRIYTQVWYYLKYKMCSFYAEGSYFAIFEQDKKKLTFIDSLNVFKGSLENLGKQMEVETQKKQIDFKTNVCDSDLIERCRTDTLILKEIMSIYFEFIKNEKLGTQKMTIASQSLEGYLCKFYDPNVNNIHIHTKDFVLKLERDSYSGGRTEVFKMGLYKDIYVLDVNSMYPFVMTKNKYPIQFNNYNTSYTVEELLNICKSEKYCVVSKVIVNIPEGKSIVPKKINGKLLFLTGEFEVSLCTPELLYLLEKGYVMSVVETSVYIAGVGLFDDYVNFFYNIRKTTTKKAWNVLAKLFLNSLYGKFGQMVGGWEDVGDCDPSEFREWSEIEDNGAEGKTFTKYRAVGGLLQKRCKDDERTESYNSFCAISSHVTSYSRLILQNAFDVVGNDNRYYCDTDSVFTNKEGYEKMIQAGYIGNELGQLKLEKIYTTLEIRGLKDYKGIIQEDNKVENKTKGIRKNDIEVSRNKYKSERWDSLHGQLARGNDEGYYIIEFFKELTREYGKGKNIDGNIIPYEERELL